MKENRDLVVSMTWGLAAGALGMAVCAAMGKIRYALYCILLGAAIGLLAGIIISAFRKRK